MKRVTSIVVIAFFITVVFVAGYVFGQSNWAPVQIFGSGETTPKSAREVIEPFWETWRFLQDEYFDQPLDDDELVEGAISGMLATLGDPNTRYLSPEQEQAARRAARGELEGIGAEVTSADDAIMIIAPYDGSPADLAGLEQGDLIREADGISLAGMSVNEAASLIRGPAGTVVRLLVERDGESFEVEVTRDIIRVPSVRGELLEEGIAYVRLSRFADPTTEELEETLDGLLSNNPIGLILDLRNNPGGNLTTAVDVADQFLDSGPILVERFGNGRERVFRADNTGAAQEIPMTVLINQGSASASEVLAGAIRDRNRGILVGQTSFGKGTVQGWKRLSNEAGLLITIARWLTPDGTWVHEKGLEPDLVVPLPDISSTDFVDSQLQAAIDYLMGRPVLEESTGNSS